MSPTNVIRCAYVISCVHVHISQYANSRGSFALISTLCELISIVCVLYFTDIIMHILSLSLQWIRHCVIRDILMYDRYTRLLFIELIITAHIAITYDQYICTNYMKIDEDNWQILIPDTTSVCDHHFNMSAASSEKDSIIIHERSISQALAQRRLTQESIIATSIAR